MQVVAERRRTGWAAHQDALGDPSAALAEQLGLREEVHDLLQLHLPTWHRELISGSLLRIKSEAEPPPCPMQLVLHTFDSGM